MINYIIMINPIKCLMQLTNLQLRMNVNSDNAFCTGCPSRVTITHAQTAVDSVVTGSRSNQFLHHVFFTLKHFNSKNTFLLGSHLSPFAQAK